MRTRITQPKLELKDDLRTEENELEEFENNLETYEAMITVLVYLFFRCFGITIGIGGL
jgi:hypothetical protein